MIEQNICYNYIKFNMILEKNRQKPVKIGFYHRPAKIGFCRQNANPAM